MLRLLERSSSLFLCEVVMDQLMKLKEVESALDVSRWTLYRWLAEGKLKAIKLVSGQYRVSVAEVWRMRSELKIGYPENVGAKTTTAIRSPEK